MTASGPMTRLDDRTLYEELYCARGEMESPGGSACFSDRHRFNRNVGSSRHAGHLGWCTRCRAGAVAAVGEVL